MVNWDADLANDRKRMTNVGSNDLNGGTLLVNAGNNVVNVGGNPRLGGTFWNEI